MSNISKKCEMCITLIICVKNVFEMCVMKLSLLISFFKTSLKLFKAALTVCFKGAFLMYF